MLTRKQLTDTRSSRLKKCVSFDKKNKIFQLTGFRLAAKHVESRWCLNGTSSRRTTPPGPRKPEASSHGADTIPDGVLYALAAKKF